MKQEEIELLVSILKNFGYSIETNKKVIGKSGIEHKFAVIAKKANTILFFNFALDDKVELSYLGMLCAYIDLKANGRRFILLANTNRPIDIGVSSLSDKIDLLTYSDIKELSSKIHELLNNL